MVLEYGVSNSQIIAIRMTLPHLLEPSSGSSPLQRGGMYPTNKIPYEKLTSG